MNDTEILNQMLDLLKLAVRVQRPLSPANAAQMIGITESHRGEQRRAPPFQHYWRCAHYPSAIDNYFSRDKCEHGCLSELRGTPNECKPATS